jgi:hypothetical protein
LTISDRDLADLAYAGLLHIHKAKLEGQEFLNVSQVLQKALANEGRVKESGNLQNLNEKVKHLVHLLNYKSDNLDDCGEDVYATEFTWSYKDTPHICGSLNPVHRNQQDEMKFTFDVEKCDKSFNELLSIGKIKLSYDIPPIDDLKKRAHYKWYSVLIVSGIILILMLLTIAMYFNGKYNRPSMKANCVLSKCSLTTIHSQSMTLIYKVLRYWFVQNRPSQLEARM